MANEGASDSPGFVLYRYNPSLPAAAIFIALFAMTTLLHFFQIVKKRTWYFIPLAIGGIFEVLGYVGRALSTKDRWALGPYIMQTLLLLVAPALFAASIYIILGRIIIMVDGERHSLVPQKWLTSVFVTGDVLSFVIQGAGGGIMGASNGKEKIMKLGETLIIVGLFIQLVFFGAFVIVSGIFHYRVERSFTGKATGAPTSVNLDALPWKRHLIALYIASALVFIRSVFRVIEYIQGNAGYLLRTEVFLYIFDGALMFMVMIIFNWVHPSQVTEAYQQRLRGSSSIDVPMSEATSGADVELQSLRVGHGAGP